jgi:hypothetical protein
MSKPNNQLPYYGSTREEVIARGLDPDDVEAGRLYAAESRAQAALEENVNLVAAALQAVEQGEKTHGEVAQALLMAGRVDAHDAFVSLWQDEERQFAEQEAVELVPFLDANEYAMQIEAQRQAQLQRDEAEAESLTRQLAQKQVEEVQGDLKSLVETTPGVQQFAPEMEQRLVQKFLASGVLPSTPKDRADAIEESLKETAVVNAATEEIRQQVDTECRILFDHPSRPGRDRDGLMTEADKDAARAAYKRGRFKQLADAKMIDLESLKPSPTAEEESAALADKYREREAKSTDFRTQVAGIEKRGADANASRDRGEGMTEERKRYQEALARAEAGAQTGTVTTSLTVPQGEPSKPTGRGPDGTWPDDLGPAI